MKTREHKIIHTYFDRHGRHLISGVSTGIRGATCEEAYSIYKAHVASATKNKRLVGVILIDHEEVVLAEWNANVKEEA